MARMNADTNSFSSSDFAAVATLMMSSLSWPASLRREPGKMQNARDDDHRGERNRQKHLPAQPHQLVVAIARHDRLRHREQEEHEADLQHEPDHAGHPG